MRRIASISRVILGLLFIFSGTMKGIDPMGSALKFTEYFGAFGMDGLSVLAPALSILLSAVELTLGLMLVMKLRIAFTSLITLIFMSCFTLFTLFIAITNPVADCGCFGDAIKLTNWQTFVKNLVFLALAAIAYWRYRKYKIRFHAYLEAFMSVLLLLTTCLFFTYYYRTLPGIDLLPFKAGTNIAAEINAVGQGDGDVYETTLKYKNRQTGEIHIFSVEDTTWYDDTIWEFVDSNNVLVKKGEQQKIKDFFIFNQEGDNVTANVLNMPNLIVLTAYDVKTLTPEGMTKFRDAVNYAHRNKYNVIGLTSSNKPLPLDADCYNIDATTLKTMIRSSEGMMLLNNGVVVAKWSTEEIPDFNNIDAEDFIRIAEERAAYREITTMMLFLITIIIFYVVFRYTAAKR